MILFISIAIVLTGFSLMLAVWPLLTSKNQPSDQKLNHNAHLNAIDDALLSGILNVSEHEKMQNAVKLDTPNLFTVSENTKLHFSAHAKFQMLGALIFIVTLLVIVAPAVYLQIGTPLAIDTLNLEENKPKQSSDLPNKADAQNNNPRLNQTSNENLDGPATEKTAQAGMTQEQIEAMVQKLALKLKENPKNLQGWRMLARSYETLHRFDQAVEAYKNLLLLTPDDPEVLTDYAVTLAMSLNQSLAGAPEKLIQHALEVDPDNLQALALLGSVSFERKDYHQAIKYWKKIVRLEPGDSALANSVASGISKAEALIKQND